MFFRRVVPVLLAAATFGCEKKAEGPPPRYFVLRFENLSGDASLDWAGGGASEVLTRMLSGALSGPVLSRAALGELSPTLGARPGETPGTSGERTAAKLAGATRLITGYIERAGGADRVTAVEEDLSSGKTVRTVSAVAPGPLQAFISLAKALSAKAGAPPTTNEDALRSYCLGRDEDLSQAASHLRRAVASDPNFGEAWVSLVQADMALGDKEGADAALADAKKNTLDKRALAYLDFSGASLHNDQAARLDALKHLVDFAPVDTVLIRTLAESQMGAGQFAAAAEIWKKLLAVLPADPDGLNQLGYTTAWAGDYPGAVAVMKRYAALLPADPNPLDSLGDVHYLYRKFPEAAKVYLELNAKHPEFQEGGGLYKAAWSKYMAGDKAGADATFAQFRKAREKEPSIVATEGDWLYRTGRKTEAMALVRKTLEQTDSPVQPSPVQAGPLRYQLAVWQLLAGDRAGAAASVKAGGQPNNVTSILIWFCAMPSASEAEWEVRGQRILAAPAVAGLRATAVAYALLLDGKKDAALKAWKAVAENSKANDFAARALYSRLRGEQARLEVLPDPKSLNPLASVLSN